MGLFDPQLPTPSPVLGGQPKTGRAEAITQVGKLALQAYEGKAVADLRTKLNEIASYRQAGKSSTWAQARANTVVSEAINRLPGSADLFRKEAATTFGTFGSAQGVLDQTEEEKLNASILAAQVKKMTDNGLNPNNPDDIRVQQEIDDLERNTHTASLRQQLQGISQGDKDRLTWQGLNERANVGTTLWMNFIAKNYKEGISINNIEAVLARLDAEITSNVTELTLQNPNIDPTTIQNAMENRYKLVRATLEGLSTGRITEQQVKDQKNALTRHGNGMFPLWAVAHAVGGDAAVGLVNQLTAGDLTPAQKEWYISGLKAAGVPEAQYAEALANPSAGLQQILSPALTDLSKGVDIDVNNIFTNTVAYNIAQQAEKTQTAPKSPETKKIEDNSIAVVATNKPDQATPWMVTKEKAAWTRGARTQLNLIHSNLYQVLQENPNYKVTFDNYSNTFVYALADPNVKDKPPKELVELLDTTNRLLKIAQSTGNMEYVEQHINQIRFMVNTGQLAGPINSKGDITPAPETEEIIHVDEQGNVISSPSNK